MIVDKTPSKEAIKLEMEFYKTHILVIIAISTGLISMLITGKATDSTVNIILFSTGSLWFFLLSLLIVRSYLYIRKNAKRLKD